MIDFTASIEELNRYKGSEKKKTLIYNQKKYLVKFPDPIREKNKKISYINNTFSEYIGSNIFKLIGFETQTTLLGKYIYNDKSKIVCACEDFTDENHVLYEFENIALSSNPDKKIETELADILNMIEEIQTNPKTNITILDNLEEKFFEMLVVDALIGNLDRHNGNWGLLVQEETKEAKFSPIYDCGSCLNPMLEDEEIENMDKKECKNLALNMYSCIKENGKKINFLTYIESMKNEKMNQALKNIFPRIDRNQICELIDEIECISKVRKEFYKEIIQIRYQKLNQVYKKLKEK